ncbi:MAG: hypothetical protein QOF78_494 [Phycisphaerales bacterium]|jgi:hypothetical protein|nr:hypothetical protein [Phycisphaerales bacterium]
METDVVCSDCGKVIAPPGAVENVLRCRCAEKRLPKISVDDVPTRPRISVPIPEPEPESNVAPSKDDTDALEAPSSPTSTEKKCYVCGADLAGRVRLKDHLGRYWCKECAAADDRAKKREEEMRCADCSRVFPMHKLQYFQTDRVCATCYKAREKALERKILKANAVKTHKAHEFGKLKWMALIALGLIVLATIFQMSR